MSVTHISRSPDMAPSVAEPIAYAVSDDECLSRLANAVAEHDDRRLSEVAQLIGRLAVPIE